MYGSCARLPRTQFTLTIDTDFVALGASNAAWNVTRSTFDDILLRHAQMSGAQVFEGVRVASIDFVDYPKPSPTEDWHQLGTPTRAHYTTDTGESGEIEFDYLIDASGRAGIISNKWVHVDEYIMHLSKVDHGK